MRIQPRLAAAHEWMLANHAPKCDEEWIAWHKLMMLSQRGAHPDFESWCVEVLGIAGAPIDVMPHHSGEVVQSYVSDNSGSPIVLPSEIGAMLRDLRSDSDRLDNSYIETGLGPTSKKPGWPENFTAWRAFLTDLRTYLDSEPSTWWGSTADQVDVYRKQLVAWQDKLKSFGGTLIGPDIAGPDQGSSSWIFLAGAVAAGGVMWALRKVIFPGLDSGQELFP